MTGAQDYAYLGRWNYSLHTPVPDESWITEAEARGGLEAGVIRCDIVPGEVYSRRDERPRPSTSWVITAFGGGVTGFKVFRLTRHGSISSIEHFQNLEGRLFVGNMFDYTYPDDRRYYRQSESTTILHGIVKPDGTGFLTINDKSRPTVERLSMDQVDVSNNWLDRPAFGDWHVLLDPDLGTRLTRPTRPAVDAPRPPLGSRVRSALKDRFTARP